MSLPFKKNLTFITCLVCFASLGAQTTTHMVTATFLEDVIAEISVNKVVNNKLRSIARFDISPDDKDFEFAIPKEPGTTYRLQINLMKPGVRQPKLDKICIVPLSLNPERDYTLKITPSKLDMTKKSGWELKQDAASASAAWISGKMVNGAWKMGTPLSLHHVVNGTMVSGSSFNTNAHGSFDIPCQIKQEGFYYLSSPGWNVRMYLKPSDKLELNIDSKTGNTAFINGSRENQMLFQWQQLISPITSYGYNLSATTVDSIDLTSYISSYEKLQPAMDQFYKNVDQTNAIFSKAFRNAMDVDRELAPLHLLYQLSAEKVNGLGIVSKDFDEVPSFYQRFIQTGKFGNASLLLLGETRLYMGLYAKLNVALLSKEQKVALSQREKLQVMMDAITNDTLKSFFFLDQIAQMEVNNLSEFRETFAPFKSYAKSAPVKSAYQSLYDQFIDDTAYIGKSAYNFSLPDTTGRMVSMKDFEGKVVLIDVWATWCGPCKVQIPFYKEIEEEYKDNKDMVFVSISIDRKADREKWLKMIRKENLSGVQLLDDLGKAFARPNGIIAIPRFLLIDKQGKWIEIRCPRPSAKEDLQRYLDRALKQP
jgi:thiol-disulfide isomerase/thioredoxin